MRTDAVFVSNTLSGANEYKQVLTEELLELVRDKCETVRKFWSGFCSLDSFGLGLWLKLQTKWKWKSSTTCKVSKNMPAKVISSWFQGEKLLTQRYTWRAQEEQLSFWAFRTWNLRLSECQLKIFGLARILPIYVILYICMNQIATDDLTGQANLFTSRVSNA